MSLDRLEISARNRPRECRGGSELLDVVDCLAHQVEVHIQWDIRLGGDALNVPRPTTGRPLRMGRRRPQGADAVSPSAAESTQAS